MTWATPKTDWDTDDAVGTTDLNRIEGNEAHSSLVLGHGNAMQNIASANNLDITLTTNIFFVTGNTEIHFIKTTGRSAGAIVYLVFEAALLIQDSYPGAGAGYANIVFLAGDNSTSIKSVRALIFDGTQWRWLADNF